MIKKLPIALFDEAKHKYYIRDIAYPEFPTDEYTGHYHYVPSVSTILSVLAKPALPGWAAKVTAEYFRVIFTAGIMPPANDIDRLIEEAKREHRKKADDAATVGTITHLFYERAGKFLSQNKRDLIEENEAQHIINEILKEYSIDNFQEEQIANTINSYKEFQSEWIIMDTEIFVFGNRYCGTLDAILLNRKTGKHYLVDYKTSAGVYSSHIWQCLLYYYAYLNHPLANKWEIDGIGIIRFDKEETGYKCHIIDKNEPSFYKIKMSSVVDVYYDEEIIKKSLRNSNKKT